MLKPGELKELSKINTYRTLFDITHCWALVALSLYICHINYLWAFLLCPVIASRLHALGIIMHDGSHYLISQNKMFNDLVSNIFCSFPLMISTQAYRDTHHPHHRYTQTTKDPNYVIMRKEDA